MWVGSGNILLKCFHLSVLETEAYLGIVVKISPFRPAKHPSELRKTVCVVFFKTPPEVAWFLNWSNHWVINLTKTDSRHYAKIIRQESIYLEKTDTQNNLLEPRGTTETFASVLGSSEGKALWRKMNEREQFAWQKKEHLDQLFEEW